MPAIFPFLGRTQLQVVSALSGLLLIITSGITIYSAKERVLLEPSTKAMNDEPSTSILGTIKDIWSNVLTLPYVIMRIVRTVLLSL